MKRILLFIFTVLSFGIGFGQVTTIDFETAGDGYTPSGTAGAGFTDVFNRTNPNIGGNASFIWSVEDMTLSDPSIVLDQIDITGSSDFTFSIDMLAHHFEDWDNTDELLITYSIDGGLYQNLMWVQMVPSDNFNGPAALDLGFDNDGDCGVLTTLPSLITGTQHGCTVSANTFQTFTTSSISLSSNSTLDIILQFNGLDGTDEGIYLDNITITETAGSSDTELNFASATYSESENGGSINLCVDITNESATATSADIVLTSASAPHLSYTTTGVTFPSSSSAQQCVTVNIADNAICGDATDYTFEIQNVSGGASAAVGSIDETTLSISDDDGTVGAFQTLSFEAGDNWAYTGTGSLSSDANKFNGTMSYEMNSNESIELDNISLAGYTNVTLSVAYAATGVDGGDDLDLEISYDGGSTYTDTKLVDGSGNYSLNINVVGTVARNPVQANPYIINIPPSETQIRVRFSDHGADGSDYYYVDDIILSGEQCLLATPEINVQGNTTDIPDGNTAISFGDSTNFGDVLVSSGSNENTFTIQNTGTGDLNITSVSSSNNSEFALGGSTSGVITAGNDITFTVTFDPSSAGTKTSTITILSDDGDEATYDFAVEGNGTLACVTPSAQATSLSFANITFNSIDVSYTASSPTADNYIVVQSTTATLSAGPVDATTYTVSDPLGGGIVVYNGSGTSFTASGLSPSTQYYFHVYAYNDAACSGGPNYFAPALTDNETTTIATGCVSFFSDDFSGTLSQWSNTGDWTIASGELKHNLSSTAGSSYIYSDIGAQDLSTKNYEWSFCIRNGNWDPSGGNKFSFFLLSSTTNLLASPTGYAVGVNQNATDDLLTLYSVSSGAYTSIVTSALIWGTNDDVCVRVTRTSTGDWQLFYDDAGAGEVSGGTANNTTNTAGSYIGQTFEFSATRAGLLWTDDVNVCSETLAAAPEINIQGNATDIPSGNTAISVGDDTDFGDVLVAAGTNPNTFTIQNTGTADLNITSVVSSNNTEFAVSGTTSGVITSGNSATFTITFDPSAIGPRTSTITIASDDADEASYTFDIEGNGTAVPDIVLSSANPAVNATNIQADSDIDNTVIYAFDLSVTSFDAELTAFDFVTSGSYAAGNITNFKAWYSVDATFDSGSDTFLDNVTSGLGTGSHTFSGFSQTISNGTTGYVFVTVDLPCGATANNTIIVDAITIADLTFVAGNKSGTAFASATHTITEVVPNNITALATANCENGGVDLSWTAATGCLDNYLVVASPTALTTAPSTGPTYTANAVYGSGTPYDGGFIVYEGSGTSVSISNLTNGTNYTYTVFTRNGTSWSSGVEVDCTPSLVYCTFGPWSSGDSEIENVSLTGENNSINNPTIDICTNTIQDNTAMSADLNQGDTYTLSVEFGDCDGGTLFSGAGGVWIDWNGDGDFDDLDEEIGTVAIPGGGANVIETFSIAVDIAQPVGSYVMRIVQDEGGTAGAIDPCVSPGWGTVVDYSIEVLIPCTPTHTFTSMIPTTGPEETEVTIIGSGFTASTTASLGGVAATVEFVDATTLILSVPPTASTGEITLLEASCPIATGIFTVIAESGICINSSGSFTDLIISEVYDSDFANEWYMELYNPTASSIDLAAGDYEIDRYADLVTSTVSNNVDLTGTVPAYSVFILSLGSSSTSCPNTYDININAGGINEEDRIILTKGGVNLDVVETPNETGYSILRLGSASGPITTFDAADWDILSTEDCSDIGVAPVTSFSNPIVTDITDDSDCFLLDYSISVTEGDLSTLEDLTYQWYFNDGVSAGFTAVTAALPAGYTILGETGVNLLIEGDVNSLEDLDSYQFYCEVTEDGTCENVSNAELFNFDAKRFYQSVATGNWDLAATWQIATSAAGPWTSACTYPTETNSDYISIEDGHEVTLNLDLSADQIIIQATGKLTLDEELTVANGNTSGEDLEVIGTLQDNGSTANGVDFVSGGTWSLGAAGTVIKTSNSSVARYRDNYETGIANIPATADWFYSYDASSDVANNVINMYYPNLYFESSAGAHLFDGFSEVFKGSSGTTIVKGNLGIGTTNTGTVNVYTNNINATPITVMGDLEIGTGSSLLNEQVVFGAGNGIGTGFDIKGDIIIDGLLDFTDGTGLLKTSGSASQLIGSNSASGVLQTYAFEIDNTADNLLLDIDIEIDNTLTFTNGKIITDVTSADMVWVKNTATSAIVGSLAQSGLSKYVEGKLQWTTDGTSTYTFPVGASGTYGAQGFTIDLVTGTSGSQILTFLELNNTLPIEDYAYCDLETPNGGAGQIGTGIGTPDGIADQIEFNIESDLQWDITNPNGGITEYDLVVLATGDQDINPISSTNGTAIRYLMKNGQPGNPTVATTDGAPAFSTTGFDVCPNQYTLLGLTSFSKFTLNGATITNTTLPVELLFFKATIAGDKKVLTSWSTATEINNDYFTVERSIDGENFEAIGNITGAGNYSGKMEYELLDKEAYEGVSYYRLKQTDFDGTFTYSEIITVDFKGDNSSNTTFEVYPNPFTNSVIVDVNNGEDVTAIIYDLSGKLILSETVTYKSTLDLSDLASGTYLLNLRSNSKSENIKLVKN